MSFIDVGADAAGDGAAPEAKGQIADEKAKRAQDDTSDSGEPDSAATKDPEPVVDSDSSMVPDATGKSRGHADEAGTVAVEAVMLLID